MRSIYYFQVALEIFDSAQVGNQTIAFFSLHFFRSIEREKNTPWIKMAYDSQSKASIIGFHCINWTFIFNSLISLAFILLLFSNLCISIVFFTINFRVAVAVRLARNVAITCFSLSLSIVFNLISQITVARAIKFVSSRSPWLQSPLLPPPIMLKFQLDHRRSALHH